MNKELPCYIVSDLLPLYQDDMLSEETRRDIDQHIKECNACKKMMDSMKVQINVKAENKEIDINPLKKIKVYQTTQTILGAVIAFLLGSCLPIVRRMLPIIIGDGEIPDYYLARLKAAWQAGLIKMGISGIVLCVVYMVVLGIVKKVISKK
jgi:hypothetical protein